MKNVIIDTIIKIAGEVGLENVTTKKIAKALEISEGTIYRHFASKEEFMQKAYLHICTDADEFLRTIAETNNEHIVEYYFDSCLDYWCAHHDFIIFLCQLKSSNFYTLKLRNEATQILEAYKDTFYEVFGATFNYDMMLLDKFLNIAKEQIFSLAYRFAKENTPIDSEEKAAIVTLLNRMTVSNE